MATLSSNIRLKRTSLPFVLAAVVTLLLSGCDKTLVMEKNAEIKNYRWDYADVKTFEAEIADTSLTYNLYVNMRHAFSFEWRNAWVDIETVFPDGTTFHKRVNLPLSQPDGQWFGDCLGDNCDIQVPIQSNAYFPQPGRYIFKLKQDMRVNPLGKVKSIGMRIEKNEVQQSATSPNSSAK